MNILPVIGIIGALSFSLILLALSLKSIVNWSFKSHTRIEVAKLRHDYYSQQNRTPEKDAEFESEVQEVERKYGLI